MKRLLAALLLASSMAGIAGAIPITIDQNLASTVVVATTSFTFDMSQGINKISAQVNVASTTPASASFDDGRPSSATITIVSTAPLVAIAGTNQLHVVSTNSLTQALITINGHQMLAGNTWAIGVSTAATALSIASFINNYSEFTATATTNSSTVTITCAMVGTACNAYGLTVQYGSNITAKSATFTGGQNAAFLNINGTVLTEGVDFNLGATSTTATTATSIAAAIQANSALNTIIIDTAPASSAVVYATSSVAGVNAFYLFSSNTGITTQANFLNGKNPGYSSSIIALPAHGMATGQAVLYSTSSGVSITPLVTGTTYYAIAVTPNSVEVSTTQAQALAGTHITLTGSSTTGPHTFTLAPLAFSGNCNLTWYGSNDNINFSTANVSAQVASTSNMPTSFLWDFGNINYRYLQLGVAGPTTGGLSLTAIVHGSN